MNKKVYIIIFILFSIFLISPMVFSACQIQLNKNLYSPGAIATATMRCDDVSEKNTAYTLNWTNGTTGQLQLDSGTTPPVQNQTFSKFFNIPTTANYNITANLSFTTTQKAITYANITGASIYSLVISNPFVNGKYLGRVSSIKASIYDYTLAKKVTGASCHMHILTNDKSGVLTSIESESIDGDIAFEWILGDKEYLESTSYYGQIHCYCGTVNETGCLDGTGSIIQNSVGTTEVGFDTKKWLNVNTLVDQTNYIQKEEMFICTNLTNIDWSYRLNTKIYHQVRCSSGIDNNNDLDRALIISDDGLPDFRGINNGTTQMQCKRFIVPEPRYLQGKSSQCYASTIVEVLDQANINPIISYRTTSPLFNITLSDLNINPDWQRQSIYVFNSIINLSSSSYEDYNASTDLSNLDIRLDKIITNIQLNIPETFQEININKMLLSRYIKNWTVYNQSGSVVTNSGLEINDDGNLELEVRNSDISKSGYYNITLYLNSWEEIQAYSLNDINGTLKTELNRSSTALEEIANKTGTFHFSIDCPAQGTIEDSILCEIKAQIESDQSVQKEVDFNCYLLDNKGNYYSTTNWNQMITKSLYSIQKSFLIPTSIEGSSSVIAFCEASYYNFGSRTDTFSDTFQAILNPYQGGGISEEKKEEKEPIINQVISGIEEGVKGRGLLILSIFFIALSGLFIYGYREEIEKNYYKCKKRILLFLGYDNE